MPGVRPFQPQPPEVGLNPKGLQSLESLLRAQSSNKHLLEHINKAKTRLTEIVSDLNDRAGHEDAEFRRKFSRFAQNEESIDGEEQAAHEAFQQQAADLTRRMDHAMRKAIDSSASQAGLSDIFKEVSERTSTVSQATQIQQRQSDRTASWGAAASEAGEDADAAALEIQDDNDEPLPPPHPSNAPSALLRDALEKDKSNWATQTPTQRYSKDNDYTGFYTAVFYAKNPGDDPPPVPHPEFWFADEEGREVVLPRLTEDGGGAEGEGDSDLEVASVRGGITCPLTLRRFTDPWKSKKCKHTFEKEAIFNLILSANTFVPYTPEQCAEIGRLNNRQERTRKEKEIRLPQMRCPVCVAMLTVPDLEPDPLLLRKVKRIEEQEKRQQQARVEAEDSSDDVDDEVPRGTQRRPVGLGSSPATRTKIEQIKRERVATSQNPDGNTGRMQITAAGATIVELGSQDEDMTDS